MCLGLYYTSILVFFLLIKKPLLISVYLCYKLYDIINYNIIELSQINILVADPGNVFFFSKGKIFNRDFSSICL